VAVCLCLLSRVCQLIGRPAIPELLLDVFHGAVEL
jgi:hypothetical protein